MARREARAGYLFILPTYVFYFFFMLIPLGMTIYYSFTSFNMVKPPEWIGIENYVKMLQDKVILTTFNNTILYAIATTILKVLFGFILAVLFHLSFYFAPFVASVAAFCFFLMWLAFHTLPSRLAICSPQIPVP